MINFFLIFIIGLGIVSVINFEKKVLINNIFFYLLSNFIFIFTVLILPEGFADDQYEYFDFMKYNFNELNLIKYQVMYIITYIPIQIMEFSMLSTRYLFFTSYVIVLLIILKNLKLGYLSLPVLIVTPSIFLHASLFLREPVSYIFIASFIYFVLNKKFIFSLISFFIVFLIRPDSAGLIAPFFLMLFQNRRYLQNFGLTLLLITYLYLVFYSPISTFLDGYRFLFGLPEFNLDISSFYNATANILFGSMILEIPTLIIIFETFIILFAIAKMKNKKVIVFIWFVGVMIVGSISDNSGFIVRMRSPLILITILYFLFESYTLSYKEKKNLQRSLS